MIDTGSDHGGRPKSNLLYKYSELVGPAVDWLWENGLKMCIRDRPSATSLKFLLRTSGA